MSILPTKEELEQGNAEYIRELELKNKALKAENEQYHIAIIRCQDYLTGNLGNMRKKNLVDILNKLLEESK